MNSFARSHEIEELSGLPAGRVDESRDAVLAELERILASRFFRSAERSRQFLRYVVEHKLTGHPEQLKERTIGTEVFLRPQGYSTGDDPVVRVQAGEVRRRIEQFYQASPDGSTVRIELPVGSYSPVFLWASTAVPVETLPSPAVLPMTGTPRQSHRLRLWTIAALSVALALAVGTAFRTVHRPAVKQPLSKTSIDQFWNPVFASQQPVVICLGTNLLRPLDPSKQSSGSDTILHTHLGVPVGDVYAALGISTLLSKINKPGQLRIGANCSFDDLRSSPAVAVGAFNNKWTLQLLSNLRFAFVSDNGLHTIRELPPGNRVWQTQLGADGEVIEDFAIVSRLLDSRTGQFTVTVAGIGPYGTQAAGDLISNPQYLEQALRNAPADWTKKNLEIVLETMGTDSIAGSPHVLATYFW